MQWTNDVTIETPEQIDVSLELAGLGSRFVAQVIDWVIKWAVQVLVALVVLVALSLVGFEYSNRTAGMLLLACLVSLFYAFALGYDIYFEVRRNGQTPGKKMAGIRVIREGGAPLDFPSACIRNLLKMADFLPVFYLLGAVLVLLSSRNQRLGDMAAGTIVVRERALAPPADPRDAVDRLASGEFVFTSEQVAACSPGDRYILRSFYQRYHDMDPVARQQLAGRLAAEFVRKTAYQPNSPIPPGPRAEAFLASLYRDIETRAQLAR